MNFTQIAAHVSPSIHSLKSFDVQDISFSHVSGVDICLSSLSSSIQPRRGGHIMVHHSEGLCQRGNLRQGVSLNASTYMMELCASFDNI